MTKMQKLLIETNNLVNRFPALRHGQALMNSLSYIDLDTYKEVVSGENDPFYDDDKINNFLNFLNKHWYEGVV